MPARKTDPSNTVNGQLKAFKDAQKPPKQWPSSVPLPADQTKAKEALRQFESILKAKPSDDWTEYEFVGAANLAVLEINITELTAKVSATSGLVQSPNNHKYLVRDPALDALSMLMSLRGQLHKQLGLGFTAQQSLKGKRNAENSARTILDRASSPMYDLLA
jgi:hypothetical protein